MNIIFVQYIKTDNMTELNGLAYIHARIVIEKIYKIGENHN